MSVSAKSPKGIIGSALTETKMKDGSITHGFGSPVSSTGKAPHIHAAMHPDINAAKPGRGLHGVSLGG